MSQHDHSSATASSPSHITVVIADSNPMVRHGVKITLEGEPDILIVGEAATGDATFHLVRTYRPDVLLLDYQLPDITAVEILEQLRFIPPAVSEMALAG